MRSQLRRDEENGKANDRRVDDQINALRSTVLSSMTSRQAAFDQRRVEAVDKFWINVSELRSLKSLLLFTQTLKMDEVMRRAAAKNSDGEAMRSFLTMIWKMYKLDKFKNFNTADTERPFLSPLTWATYIVYHQVLYFPLMQISLGRLGAGFEAMKDSTDLLNSVAEALPHRKDYLEIFGSASFSYVIDELEQLLLDQIVMMVGGQDANQQSLEQAKNIIAAVSQQATIVDPKLRALVPEAVRRDQE
ncbi:hypothetical protein [Methylobacterium brachiatum]